MCGGVLYHFAGQDIKTYFPNPNAKLPILKKDGTTALLPWGRREKQAGNLPMGGWSRLESINNKVWDKYFPMPVKLPLSAFMEKDIEGKSHWFPISAGQWVQGLLARYDKEMRVYVVTIVPEREDALYHRWPRICVG